MKHLTVAFLRFLDSRFLKVLCESVFYLTPEIALKRTSKRRTWTTAEVRELKSLARKKTPAKKNRQNAETKRGRNAAEGRQYRIVTRLADVTAKSSCHPIR